MSTHKKLFKGVKKKNQWRIANVHANKVSYCPLGFGNNKRSTYQFGTFIRGALTVLISVLIIYGVVQAGTITPPSGAPEAQFYTLSEIYEFITNNTTATEGGHIFTFSDSLTGTGRTLTEIYNALTSLISADKVKLGTTYLGVDGTLVPSGGDATAVNVLTGKTFFGDSQTNWNLQTGTMTNIGQQTITPGTSNTVITQGYHDGTGYCEGDADLISGNIKSGVNIFNVAGDSNVVDTSSGNAGTGDIVNNKIAWVDGTQITGTFASSTATATTEGEVIEPSAGTWLSKVTVAITNLIASIIKSGETVGGVAGELTPTGGASEGLTATNAFCGHKYFGSGATSWTTQEGTGCSVCKECSAGFCVNITNDTQDTTDDLGIAGTCDQTCKKCSAGNCVNQASNEDLFAQCGGSSCCGYCDGSGSCAYVANGLTCTTPGDSCSGDYKCNGSGACEPSLWDCGDALAYGGQNYATVQIGAQCWMAENLKVTDGNEDQDCTFTRYCYDNNSSNCDTYGGLYVWADAMCGSTSAGAQGICPNGWHIPTHDEWTTLERAACDSGTCVTDFPYDTTTTGWRGTDEGSKLAGNAALWTNGALDSHANFGTSGFNLLPAGYRLTDGSYYNLGYYTYVWSSLESGSDVWRRRLDYDYTTVHRNVIDKLNGFSVRCLKN